MEERNAAGYSLFHTLGGGCVRIPHLHLQPLAMRLLCISGLFGLSVGLSNVFVNIFIWKVDESFVAIALYNIGAYFLMPIAFTLAGMLSNRLHTVWALRIGVLLHISFYTVVLFIGETAAAFPYLLGALIGLAGGFYWFSFNMLSLSYTEAGKRDGFFSLNGVVNALAGMIAPPLSGLLITYEDRFGGLTGYHVIFGISLTLFFVGGWLSMRLTARKLSHPLCLQKSFSALRTREWRMTIAASAVYGLREGVFLFLISLLMYITTGSELKLGNFLLLQGGLSFIAFFVVGRLTNERNRLKILGYGATGMAFAALLFLLPITSKIILFYGACIAVAIPFFLIPLQAFVFDQISHLEAETGGRAEHVIVREIFSNTGRVVGILAFLLLVLLDADKNDIATFAVGLGFVQLFAFILLKSRNQANSDRESAL
jgi:MFS transporter, YQGE family, putative transporter